MRAAIFDAPFSIRMAEAPKPEPQAGEVLVRVKAAGLCAGDLYIYTGKNPYVSYPRIGCHEISGVVETYGPGSSGPAIGTRVVVDPFIGCGHCYPCRVGKRNCCANLSIVGVHREGGFADFVTAPAGNLNVVPDGLTDFGAAFAEPVAIGVQGCRRGMVSAQDTMLVLGAGPIGLAIVEVARAHGAKVYATDLSAERLSTAADLGAIPIAGGAGLLERVLELTNGEGMPVVMEATGAAPAMEQTIDLVAAGGRVVILGLVRKGQGITFPGLDFTRKEVTILGSRASVDCFPEALELLACGKIRYPKIASSFALGEAPGVFRKLADNPMALHKAVFVSED
ncbi:Alcohol dehydrogenase GroES domain protein [Mesorhizobium metallidurans STM 2683]|uniref:Alcohol dehydrogenase GroES domain protein n=1 Tax=Mesorhizobium metallidurans STM 2683 TaxID=1297569 RepID=M5F9F8_9HYPH|nr:alcohol dehydrogenase catalytic domain-containing protein [Mesorhizobium metallidurans]CCV08556.1 Alcohol dehydrogenase GroES domain protein [Mesorhizobium metallidurans STM 2683]